MKLRRISLAVLSVLLSAVTALSGFMVYTQLSDRQKEKEEFDTLAEMVEVTPEKPNDETAVPTDDTSKPVRDLSGLFSQNGDCIGWLCIPDTAVNYPVMHTPENPQKYLRRSFYGEYSQSGVPFLDRRCGLNSDNLIIYGHNMRDGSMFGQLVYYRDEDFYKAHPTFTFDTLYEHATWQVVAALDTALGADEQPYYTFFDAANKLDWQRRVEAITALALYDTGVTPEYGTQLLPLSTCGDPRPDTDTRFAILAMRVG